MRSVARSVTMSAMSSATVTIFGGTGFLGRRIARQALNAGWTVRIGARHARPGLFAGEVRQPEHVAVDIRDPDAVAESVKGSTGVVNAVSLYVESRSESFQSIHVDAAGQVARAANAAAARLVHLSGIGVDRRSPSPYVRARAFGEERVREADPRSVILRPGVLFGAGDAFLSATMQMIKWLPVVPLFGTGGNRLQPVHVDDVARAAVAALDREDAPGVTYELGGPDTFTYGELLETLAARLGRKRWFLPVPFPLWHLLALMAAPLPGPPITRDQVELLRRDNIVQADKTFKDLGIEIGSLTGVLETVSPR